MDSTRDYYLEYVPELADLFDQYLVHDDVMVGHHAGPQKQARDYDPNEEPHFGFETNDHTIIWETEGSQMPRYWRMAVVTLGTLILSTKYFLPFSSENLL